MGSQDKKKKDEGQPELVTAYKPREGLSCWMDLVSEENPCLQQKNLTCQRLLRGLFCLDGQVDTAWKGLRDHYAARQQWPVSLSL